MSDKDTIYRQDAIDAINAYLGLSAVSRTIQNMTSIQEILENLPSACNETKRQATVSSDCIYRKDAIEAMAEELLIFPIGLTEAYDVAEDALSGLPSAQPERKKGEWVRNFDGNEWYWFCSNCKEKWYEEDLLMGGNDFPNFCPNCGADKRGEQDETK